MHARRAVAHRLPIGIDGAVKAELLAQDAEALLVLRSIYAVDAVIGTHGRDGLCLCRKLKGLEIDLAQRSLVHFARLLEAVVLEVVAVVVFEAGAHAALLQAVDCTHRRVFPQDRDLPRNTRSCGR